MENRARAGFTLIEMLVVVAILGVLSGALMLNFRSAGTNASARMQTANVVISDFRKIQAMAIAGTTHDGSLTCGYGIHYLDTAQYQLYVRIVQPGVSCKTDPQSRNMQSADPILETKALINANMAFKNRFPDVFFELPDPTTYIDNSLDPQGLTDIELYAPSQPLESTIISVHASGRIDIK